MQGERALERLPSLLEAALRCPLAPRLHHDRSLRLAARLTLPRPRFFFVCFPAFPPSIDRGDRIDRGGSRSQHGKHFWSRNPLLGATFPHLFFFRGNSTGGRREAVQAVDLARAARGEREARESESERERERGERGDAIMVGVTAAEDEAPVLVKSASGDPLTKEEAEVLEKEGSAEDNNEQGKCRRRARTSIPPRGDRREDMKSTSRRRLSGRASSASGGSHGPTARAGAS